MEILYLWVEEYGCLRNMDFNFGGKFKFDYNNDANILTITKNEKYEEDFFNIDGVNSVSNVTGIFGKNGVGKSTILNVIKQLVQSYESFTYIAVSIEKNSTKIWISTNLDKPKLEPDNIIEFSWNTNLWFSRFFENNNTKFIYYSNIFDSKYEQEFEQLINISTNYLCRSYRDYQKSMKENIVPESEIEVYKKKELQLQMKFIDQFLREDTGGQSLINEILPTGITMSIKTNYVANEKLFSKLKELITDKKLLTLFEYLKDSYVKKEKNHKTEISKQKAEKGHAMTSSRNYAWFGYIVNAVFHYFYNMYRLTLDSHKYLLSVPEIPGDFALGSEELDTTVLELKKYLEKLNDNIFEAKSTLIKIIDYIATNRDYFPKNSRIFTNLELRSSEFITLLFECFKISSPFEFAWNGLSSGELSLLTIFSRFLDKREDIKYNDLVILLDEPTVYMHPDWERKLLYTLIVGLPKVLDLDEKQKVQIIITSNNPIIASDLPANNVILLDKISNDDEEFEYKYFPKVVEGNDKVQTFGANIHSLYMNTFFLNDGFIGEFSKKKIEQLYNEINKISKDEYTRRDEFTRRIDMIGEKVIKKMLNSILTYKIGRINDKDTN